MPVRRTGIEKAVIKATDGGRGIIMNFTRFLLREPRSAIKYSRALRSCALFLLFPF